MYAQKVAPHAGFLEYPDGLFRLDWQTVFAMYRRY
jgi:hypothetical protein